MKLHGNGWGQTRMLSRSKGWFTIPGVVIILSLFLGSTWARAAEDDEYSFSWLDPEKKIYVLQNRKFQKANHALLSLMVGIGWSNPYRNTFNIDPRVAYYFTETLGVEFFYETISNSESNTFTALKQASPGTIPMVREIKGQFGGMLHWAPWYAKLNMFNQILYFDWYLEAGAGTIQSRIDTNQILSKASAYKDENLFALFVGTGHQYHLSQMFLVRLDVLASFYSAPSFGTTGEKQWFSNYNFTAGIGLKL